MILCFNLLFNGKFHVEGAVDGVACGCVITQLSPTPLHGEFCSWESNVSNNNKCRENNKNIGRATLYPYPH